jgi:hypothetical protein
VIAQYFFFKDEGCPCGPRVLRFGFAEQLQRPIDIAPRCGEACPVDDQERAPSRVRGESRAFSQAQLAGGGVPDATGQYFERKSSACMLGWGGALDGYGITYAFERNLRILQAFGIVQPSHQERTNAFVRRRGDIHERVKDSRRIFEDGTILDEQR